MQCQLKPIANKLQSNYNQLLTKHNVNLYDVNLILTDNEDNNKGITSDI